jgi:hypothetical protein
MMISNKELSNRQKAILEMYLNKVTGSQMSIAMKLSRSIIYHEINFLVSNGYTGKTPIVKPVAEKEVVVQEPDKFLERMIVWELNDEQKEFILNNKHLGRTEISKKLNVKKSFLNHALQKLNITLESKVPFYENKYDYY